MIRRYFADDAFCADEKGRNMDKPALVQGVTPLPKGYSGAIRVVRPQSRILGDVAILAYDMGESETIFGQDLHAREANGIFFRKAVEGSRLFHLGSDGSPTR